MRVRRSLAQLFGAALLRYVSYVWLVHNGLSYNCGFCKLALLCITLGLLVVGGAGCEALYRYLHH